MDCHSKISEPLSYDEKQSMLGRFLTNKNKAGINQLKSEVIGLNNEKEDAILTVQDQKRKLINDKEELSIIKMQNEEMRRQIEQMTKNSKMIHERRLQQQDQSD